MADRPPNFPRASSRFRERKMRNAGRTPSEKSCAASTDNTGVGHYHVPEIKAESTRTARENPEYGVESTAEAQNGVQS